MVAKFVCLSILVAVSAAAPQQSHNLPVLFQFSQPSHSVSVFRGAALKKAIAEGLVPGFGSLGREGKSDDSDGAGDSSAAAASYVEPATVAPYVAPTTTDAPTTTAAPTTSVAPTPTPAPTAAPVTYRDITPAPAPFVHHLYNPAHYRPAPVVYRPAPVVYKPAPVVYKPAPIAYKPAPAPIVYKPAPAPAYKPVAAYVEPAYAQDGLYTFEYAVKDDYTSNDFGAKEGRDGANANGKYVVALPDGRIQTVTWTVDGANGYVPVVEYAGEAQFPPEAVPAYSS